MSKESLVWIVFFFPAIGYPRSSRPLSLSSKGLVTAMRAFKGHRVSPSTSNRVFAGAVSSSPCGHIAGGPRAHPGGFGPGRVSYSAVYPPPGDTVRLVIVGFRHSPLPRGWGTGDVVGQWRQLPAHRKSRLKQPTEEESIPEHATFRFPAS